MFPKITLHVAPPSPVAVYTQPDEYQGGNKKYLTCHRLAAGSQC